MRRLRLWQIVALVTIMAALSCSGCGSKQAQYYMLSSTSGLTPVSSGEAVFTVGVGPVDLPDYLMRPEIVTRTSASEVRLAEFDRWAEPLDETMVRILVEDLSGLLTDARILGYPWGSATPIDYRVTVDVTRFEQQPDGKVHLTADWRLLDGDGGAVKAGKAALTAEVAGKGYQAIVSAMNAALAQLNEDLAEAISGGMLKP